MLSKLRFIIVCTSAFLALGAVASHAQTTINVGPGQTYTTIQSGINAANDGDTVLVAPGTYYENIDFKGKAITVTSSGGAASTIIDGSSKAPAVTFQTSEPRTAVLSNMTIQHGGNFETYTTQPVLATGGIYISGSSPTILNDTITQNNCWDIETQQAAPLIQGNEISATQDPNGQCTFGGGAAIYIGGNLNGSSVPGNGTSPFILGNTIENNVESGLEDAGGNGGAGIAVWGGSPFIEDNIIRNNSSPGGSGGAINFEFGSGATVIQNLIYNNQAGCGGGAIAFEGNPDPGTGLSFIFANNTIVNNTGQASSGYSECIAISQIYPAPDSYGSANPTAIFVNNIVSGSTTDPAVDCSWFEPPSEADQPIFDHNILYNAGGAFFGSYCIDVSSKYGNISTDPQLVDPTDNNYHLKSTSPAIDSGNNSVLQSITQLTGTQLTQDFDGNARVQDATGKGYPIIDMGAYEYPGVVDADPTTVVLTSSAYSGNAGSGYTLTATLASALGSPTGTVTFFLDSEQIGTSTISSGIATFSNFLMTPGVHALYVTYPGQGSFTPAISVIIIVDIGLYSTSLSLTSSVNPSIIGQPVLFTITASAADNSIPSPVTLTDTSTNTLLATLTPNSSGVATYTTSTLTAGYHDIEAVYAGNSTYSSSGASIEQDVINGSATSTTLTCTPSTISIGSTSLFSAAVTSSSGTPTGSIIFTDNGTTLGQPTLTSGDATLTYTGQASGTHSIVATYIPTGSFGASSASCSVTVNTLPATAILTANPTSSIVGNPVTLTATVSATNPPGPSTPTGTVTFSYTDATTPGSTTLGTVTLTSGVAVLVTTVLPVGNDNIDCTYSGSSIYSPATCISQPLTGTNPALTLTSSANPAPALTPITFTAQVPAGTTGGIVFAVDGQSIPTTPNAAGISTYTISTLTPGSYLVTATWFAANSALAAQASLTQVITAPAPVPDFSLTGSSITFSADHSATGDLQLASLEGFTGSVAITCNPPFPPNYTCSLQHPTISLTSGLSTVFTYTLQSSYTASAAHSDPFDRHSRIILASLFPLTLLSLTGFARRRRTPLRTLLTLTLLAILASATTACGPDQFIPITTGTYPITFTATGTNQGSTTPITHTLTINAIITP